MDNYTNLDLNELLKFHCNNTNNTILTMVTFLSDEPQNCGIVEINDKGILVDFVKSQNIQKVN